MATLDVIAEGLSDLKAQILDGDVDVVAFCNQIDDLIAGINELHRDPLSDKERLNAIRQVSISVGYRINTLLTGVFANIQVLQEKDEYDDESRECLNDLFKIAQAIQDVVRKMQSIKRYVTRPYVQGAFVIDLEKASRSD